MSRVGFASGHRDLIKQERDALADQSDIRAIPLRRGCRIPRTVLAQANLSFLCHEP